MINSIFYFVSFYLICGVAFACSPGMKTVKKICSSISRKQIAVSVLSAVLALLVIFLKIRQNNTVYTWDWAGYWKLSVSSTDQLFSIGLIDSIKNLRYSINNWDYNSFLPFVIALPLHFIGYSYVRYVMVVAVFFFTPAAVLVAILAAGIVKNEKPGTVFTVTLLLNFSALFFYRILLRGMIDIAIIIPMAISLMYFLEYDFKTIGHVKNVFIAGMLVMAWISRRYAVFYIVGFVCAMVYSAVVFLWKERNKKAFISTVVNFAEIGGSSLLVLLIAFKKFFLDALGTNRDAFSAYGTNPFLNALGFSYRIGAIYWIAILLIIIISVVRKQQIDFVVKLLVLGLTSAFSFSIVQSPGIQHVLIVAIPIILLGVLLMNFRKESGWLAKLSNVVYGIAMLSFFINIISYIDVEFFDFRIKNYLISRTVKLSDYTVSPLSASDFLTEQYAYPLIRNDLNLLGQIVNDINAETTKKNDTYVAVAEQLFNSDTMRNYYFPEMNNSVPSLSPVSDVDLRDGFPKYFLSATYVLACDSDNCTYNNGGKILEYINSQISDSGSAIGKNYELVKGYKIENELEIKIYRRIADYSRDDLEEIAGYFDSVYPGRDDLFRNIIMDNAVNR